jgi:hypothetical protein
LLEHNRCDCHQGADSCYLFRSTFFSFSSCNKRSFSFVCSFFLSSEIFLAFASSRPCYVSMYSDREEKCGIPAAFLFLCSGNEDLSIRTAPDSSQNDLPKRTSKISVSMTKILYPKFLYAPARPTSTQLSSCLKSLALNPEERNVGIQGLNVIFSTEANNSVI